jgi:formylglycine-generating enzyme required for sulfatase activity
MPGNVAEMTRDAKGSVVLRGGHAGYPPIQLRSAAREIENHSDPTYRNGFRIVRVVDDLR